MNSWGTALPGTWKDDTLEFECRDRESHERGPHYGFEPGTYVPVAQVD